ncbi:hypothetical protein CFOL_v3_23700, partial [Cephalotus follicularis]
CAAEGCEWRFHASITLDGRTFMLKEYDDIHTCIRVAQPKVVSSTWIASVLGFKLKVDPLMSYEAMSQILSDYKVQVDYKKWNRARVKAREAHKGKPSQSYRKWSNCCPAMFKRMFLCFGASKQGFIEGCRPFIGVDGCHLKGPYGRVMLLVISV